MKSRNKWIAIAIIVGLCATLAVLTLSKRANQTAALQAQQDAQKVQAVLSLNANDLVQAQSVELSLGLPLSGPLKAVHSAFVKARVPGDVQDLSVREGDFVAAGQALARIDPTEYQARLRQAQQQAEAAQAQVQIAQRTLDNSRALVDQGFISKTALDTSLATLASAQASRNAAQASVELAEKALQDTVLRAPIAGQIAQRLVQPGERASVDARIVEIVDLRQLELEAALSATDSLRVKVGQTAQLHMEGTEQVLSARVVRINPSAVTSSRAVLVYLALTPSAGLRQGLFVQGLLATGATQALALPLTAVRTDAPQPYVQWVRENKVVHQTVELGARGEQKGVAFVAVRGIPESATVLAGAVGTVRDGTLVQIASQAK
jgi:RND family efflux transporter MFP subunit